MPVPAPEALTTAEVAELLHVSHDTIWREIAAGELRAVTIGRRSTRVLRADLDDYLDRRASAPKPVAAAS